MGYSDNIENIADQINETKPTMILVDSTQGPSVLEAIRLSTHATFNSRVLSIGYSNDRCHNILNLIRNIDVNFVPEIAHPIDPLMVHWSRDPMETQNKVRLPCKMIRHDTMKEILRQDINDDDQETTNIVSSVQPSRVDGFLTGLNVLLQGRRGYYQVLGSGLNIETLLMAIADAKPKTLHLKPEHYLLLSIQTIPLISSKDDFSSVECIKVHGNSNIPSVDKEKLNAIFPNLQTHTFLEGEYYEYYESKMYVPLEKQETLNLNRRDSKTSTTSSSSSSSKSSNEDFHSVNSSD